MYSQESTFPVVSHESADFQSSCFSVSFICQSAERSEAEASDQSLVLGHISDERQHSFMNARSNLWPFSLCTFVPTDGLIPRKTLHIKQDKCSAVAFGHNRHGPKRGGCYAPFRKYPSSTMWPGPRSTSVPSCILIHQAVWPLQTWSEN